MCQGYTNTWQCPTGLPCINSQCVRCAKYTCGLKPHVCLLCRPSGGVTSGGFP